MNCKSLSIIAALSIAPLFAAVETGNTFCRIAVTPGTANVMLSIPLSACGTAGDIKVTDLVLTTGLSEGTVLKAEKSTPGTGWDVWTIQNKLWVATSTANAETQAQSEDPAVATLSRGRAVWLERPSVDKDKTIYLYGQLNETQASTEVRAGTLEEPVFTLLGNPKPEDFKLSTANDWKGCENGDQIFLTQGGNVVIIERKNDVWNKVTTKVIEVGVHNVIDVVYTPVTEADVTVPAGQGFWYRSVGGNPTITW